ncbi:hypothetical protein CTI12_AA474310 [Artemisia annua]|uniref:Homologous recombination OB-fold protein OB-fold domain-containing protein n=1 Tax=Artemisia annua TaxID=35608 RepID=A0A2U1LM44_ARTAN|nr:hypothetical protein CTI12_AA474310 [Artemisia annua]
MGGEFGYGLALDQIGSWEIASVAWKGDSTSCDQGLAGSKAESDRGELFWRVSGFDWWEGQRGQNGMCYRKGYQAVGLGLGFRLYAKCGLKLGGLVGVISKTGDIKSFIDNGKVAQVVAIIKSCSPNALGDLTVTLKDLSGSMPGAIHHKIINEAGGYGKA